MLILIAASQIILAEDPVINISKLFFLVNRVKESLLLNLKLFKLKNLTDNPFDKYSSYKLNTEEQSGPLFNKK